ncbi:SMI1/KNR4 family protein [Paenibacillus sp. y28]|uniref:SMI1/KNR4 family protein n=1 Tax=Paenibacillus sp. y28 TaxID=3129110 RepID=UPI00301A0AA6
MTLECMNEIKALLQPALPELADALNPPATEEEIRKAEEVLGTTFPEPLRSLYLMHNGEQRTGPGLFFGLQFLSLDELISDWKIWSDLEQEYAFLGTHHSVPLGWIKEQYINRLWIPISKDGGGNNLGIDLDPAEEGQPGQIINFGRDEETKYVISRNLTDLLQFISETVRCGNYTVHDEDEFTYWSFGKEAGDHFLDAIRSLDLPVLSPVKPPDAALPEPKEWLGTLAEEWRSRIVTGYGSAAGLFKAKKLFFINEGLEDISPLQYCRDVRELVLSANQISDITPLKGCEKLKQLYLTGNPVCDLKPLQHLAYLQDLNLSKTPVADLTPLASLPKLNNLDIGVTPVRDFTPLMQMKSLRSLHVSRLNAEQIRTLSGLKGLQHLTITGFDDVKTEDMACLGQLSSLKSLHIEHAFLPHLEFLIPCRKLEELKLTKSEVRDASALERIGSLSALELNGCVQFGDLASLASCPSLQKFTGSFQQFNVLRHLFSRKIDFSTITGGMTEEERDIWLSYNRN